MTESKESARACMKATKAQLKALKKRVQADSARWEESKAYFAPCSTIGSAP